jgi:hypothetical protein
MPLGVYDSMGLAKLGLVLFVTTTSMYGWQKNPGQERPAQQTIYLVQLDNSSKSSEFERICPAYDLNILERDTARNLYLVSASEASAAKLQAAQPSAGIERATQVLIEVENQSDITREIEALGGFAKRRFDNVPFQAAAVPIRRLRALLSIPGVKNIRKEKSYRPAQR